MQIGRIDRASRVLGESQGYLGLPVRDEVVEDTATGRLSPSMLTAWHPTPAEIAAIVAGASIMVRLLGSEHPPIMVTVGDPPAGGG